MNASTHLMLAFKFDAREYFLSYSKIQKLEHIMGPGIMMEYIVLIAYGNFREEIVGVALKFQNISSHLMTDTLTSREHQVVLC